MKFSTSFCRIAALVAAALSVHAAINVPSDGLDRDLIITTNTVVDLSEAVTANWDVNRAGWSADKLGKGVYDSNKWAVVFQYRSVRIEAGATVTFANHRSRAPVVWLVKGDVTIDGVLSLDGGSFVLPPDLAEPGPGGFRGGLGHFGGGVDAGPGFGPGGGQNRVSDRSGGSYKSLGVAGSATYGNLSLLPLIGGSGGSGDVDGGPGGSSSGGAGGGAILIACGGTLTIGSGGEITANGGNGGRGDDSRHSAGGSGGGIRLVCHTLSGDGLVRAQGGGGYQSGGAGRIRVERFSVSGNPRFSDEPDLLPLVANASPLIWLPESGPTAAIVSIGAKPAPRDPLANFGAYGADVALPQMETVPVVVLTTNVPNNSTVTVRVTPRASGRFTETIATNFQTISPAPLVIQWTADVPVNTGYSAVQVKVRRP